MNGSQAEARPILVLTAQPVEYRAVRECLVSVRRGPSHKGTVFEVGWLNGTSWRIVLAQLGQGRLAAAALTTGAVEAFAPRALFSVGVAGGLSPEVELGDVVVATKVYECHGGKETDEGFGARPVSWPATGELQQLAGLVAGSDAWWRSAHIKPVVTGDVVLDAKESALRRMLSRNYQDAVAIETEGAGAAAAAHLNDRLPALIVRGISNRADGSKRQTDAADWQTTAARNAAAFTFSVIRELSADDEDEDGDVRDEYSVAAALDRNALHPAALDRNALHPAALDRNALHPAALDRNPRDPVALAPSRLAHRTESAPPGAPRGAPTGAPPAPPSPPVPWEGGQEFSTPDCRYLLHSELLSERSSPDHFLVQHQALARRLEPDTADAASPYVWLRQTRVLQPVPEALEAVAALDREHLLLGRLPSRAKGLPGRGRYERIGNRRAVLALPWPVTRAGRPCETLHVTWGTDRRHPLAKGRLARLLAGVAGLCHTLALLHRTGATHRHLTPTGVIELDDGRLMLRDLGLAGHDPRPGEGPTSYRAPEQWREGYRPGLVGPPTDVYQLAALTYHLTTGHTPAPGGPLPLRSHLGNVPDRLERALRAALAQHPEERPGARALGSALRDARDDLLGDA
ncbi:hypothetical protein ACFV0T_01215 [Streptomyces sp. NPDC059582]|uniref:phosphorylase family protein n=1 Tax=Streptomyces sp. NPDC059582 TaxID=3346875 RepID=UPI00369041C5